MTADIVDFQKRERDDLIWICACGCSTHRHYSDGRVECASCNTIGSVSSDGWRALLPALPDAPEEVAVDSFSVTSMDSPETFMRRRMKEGRRMDAVIILYPDGGPATWAEYETASDRAALALRMAEAVDRMSAGANPADGAA